MTDTQHLEIERKYDVDERAVLPDFTGIASVASSRHGGTVDLRARYFDTADGTLAARRIVLRRREGGADEGWHIKVPAAGGRLERHWPLDTGFADTLGGGSGGGAPAAGADTDDTVDVPSVVSDVVRGRIRTRALHPIAILHTQRTLVHLLDVDGRPIVEIADDLVTASDAATGTVRIWREWEVELDSAAPGDPAESGALLDAIESRLLAAGASRAASASKLATALGRTSLDSPEGGSDARGERSAAVADLDRSSPAAAVIVAALAALVDDVVQLDARVRERQRDSVHQLRTRVRRIRSLLSSFEPIFAADVVAPLRQELTRLGAVLGQARDAEVMEERARAIIAEHESVAPAVADELAGRWHTAGEAALGVVLAELSSERYFRVLDSLDALVTDTDAIIDRDTPARTMVVERLARDVRRVMKRARVAADNSASEADRDEALHETRKAAKRLRYASEAVSSAPAAVFGKKVRTLASAAEAVHDLLGEHRDSRVMQEHLRAAAGSSAFPFDYGVLHEVERLSAALCLDDYPAALTGVERAAARVR